MKILPASALNIVKKWEDSGFNLPQDWGKDQSIVNSLRVVTSELIAFRFSLYRLVNHIENHLEDKKEGGNE